LQFLPLSVSIRILFFLFGIPLNFQTSISVLFRRLYLKFRFKSLIDLDLSKNKTVITARFFKVKSSFIEIVFYTINKLNQMIQAINYLSKNMIEAVYKVMEHGYSCCTYRYGFNGMEKDDEIAGSGNSYTAEFWEYNPRIGRRWNIDPVVKPWESSYACFANNPTLYIDPRGNDKIKFDENGNYMSGDKKGKLHEFFFGSKGYVVDAQGKTIKKFKFNDKTDGQVENFEGPNAMYKGVNLDFDKIVDQVTDNAVAGAPEGGVFSKEKRQWIINESSEAAGNAEAKKSDDGVTEELSLKLDFMLHIDEWGSLDRLSIAGNRAYNTFDAGNYLWGNAMKKLDISYLMTKLGAEVNAFYFGKLQYPSNRFGKEISYEEIDPTKFSFKRITWFGDSREDQRAIRKGYFR
jgi:hypothetical protein